MRLIDADALIAEWYRVNDIDENDRGARFVGYTEIVRMINSVPTIDAVEVVRCKDCVYQIMRWNGVKYCEATGDHIGADYDFCSNGRRKKW